MNFTKDKPSASPNEKALKQRENLKTDKIATALRANLKKRKAQANARNSS